MANLSIPGLKNGFLWLFAELINENGLVLGMC